MIPVTDLRSGITYRENGNIYEVLSYRHVKLGRGPANIKLKVKNLKSGSITHKTYMSGGQVDEINPQKRKVKYLYCQDTLFMFMDVETFEQFSISESVLGDNVNFLKEGMDVTVYSYSDDFIKVQLPIKMEFVIADASPGVKGNTTTNVWKDAKLENGYKVKVPLFIKPGDRIIIDTRTGKYIERVGK